MNLFKLNPVKKKFVYYYSKIAPYGKLLTINLDNGIKYLFRAGTMDRTVIKEVWARKIYSKYYEISEDDIVFDIGGHIGSFTVYAASKVTKGRVFAFEPFSENYNILLSNIKLNSLTNIIAENIAVSKENGSRKLCLYSTKANRSTGYNTGGHSFITSEKSDKEIEVKTETMESLMQKYNVDHINYLKLDCEGAEFEILFNTSKVTLQKVDKIVMELHTFGENTKDKMLKFLHNNGFNTIIDHYGENLYMVYSQRKA